MSDDPIKRLQELRDKLLSSRSLYFAVKETQVQVANRVWGEGKLTSGGQLTYNENYDLYAYTPPSPRKVTGKGKPYSLWKRPPADPKGDARKIKGGWYPTYLAYKQQQGRGNTPFELTGRLRKAYLSDASLVEQGPTVVQVVLRGEEADKYEGLARSKGQFLLPNRAELDFFVERLRAQI